MSIIKTALLTGGLAVAGWAAYAHVKNKKDNQDGSDDQHDSDQHDSDRQPPQDDIIMPAHIGGNNNVQFADYPIYHINQPQNFKCYADHREGCPARVKVQCPDTLTWSWQIHEERGCYYDLCPGAMVGWKLYSIHSRALRNKGAEIGDVIRCYMYIQGNIVIDKIAVVTALPGLRTTEVNIPLWGGKDGEVKPELRTLHSFGYFSNNPQTKEDGRIFHLRVKHLGRVIDSRKVFIDQPV